LPVVEGTGKQSRYGKYITPKHKKSTLTAKKNPAIVIVRQPTAMYRKTARD